MQIVHVHVRVKPESVEAFRQATMVNASHSIHEPGIARFDFFQQTDDPTRFLLVEIYRTSDANAAHKATEHYRVWSETVTDMMAEPRQRVVYNQIFPAEAV